jgi:hypothetical protein
VPVEVHASEETVEIFVEEVKRTPVADLLSEAYGSWRKTLSFRILA